MIEKEFEQADRQTILASTRQAKDLFREVRSSALQQATWKNLVKSCAKILKLAERKIRLNILFSFYMVVNGYKINKSSIHGSTIFPELMKLVIQKLKLFFLKMKGKYEEYHTKNWTLQGWEKKGISFTISSI